jgi:lysophospholipase L1-like esterase
MRFGSYVAVGDSFSEGLDDPYPDPARGFRGWADLVAGTLAAGDPSFRYANLALRGRLIGEIVTEQVPVVERLRPDLASIAGGGNDVLRPKYDPGGVRDLLDDAVGRLAGTGSTVLLFTGADVTSRMPGTARLRPRITALNETIRAVGQAHGAVLVDLEAERAFDDPRLWSDDRLHFAPAGHRWIAALVLEALGLDPSPRWREPLPFAPPLPWVRARAGDLRWARRHVAPWMRRRLAGRSSGDGLVPKRPELVPYTEQPMRPS